MEARDNPAGRSDARNGGASSGGSDPKRKLGAKALPYHSSTNIGQSAAPVVWEWCSEVEGEAAVSVNWSPSGREQSPYFRPKLTTEEKATWR